MILTIFNHRMQGFSLDQRTCKHLVEFLGEEYDNWRRGTGENAEGHQVINLSSLKNMKI